MKSPAETIRSFLSERRSLILSTLDGEGAPHTSYAPFATQDDRYYLFISEAASHTGNLTERPECSVLFIEDETEAERIFARRRVTLRCRAERIETEDPRFEGGIGLLEKRFGEMIPMLRGLQDFHLFELTPHSGEAVFGFGEAYRIETPFDAIRPKRTGHRKS